MMMYSSLALRGGHKQPEFVYKLTVSLGMFTKEDFRISFTSTTAVTSWHLVFTSFTLARITEKSKNGQSYNDVTSDIHHSECFILLNSHLFRLGSLKNTFKKMYFEKEVKMIFILILQELPLSVECSAHARILP